MNTFVEVFLTVAGALGAVAAVAVALVAVLVILSLIVRHPKKDKKVPTHNDLLADDYTFAGRTRHFSVCGVVDDKTGKTRLRCEEES